MPTIGRKHRLPEPHALASLLLGLSSWVPGLLFVFIHPNRRFGPTFNWVERLAYAYGPDFVVLGGIVFGCAAISIAYFGRPYHRSSNVAAAGAMLGACFLLLLSGIFVWRLA